MSLQSFVDVNLVLVTCKHKNPSATGFNFFLLHQNTLSCPLPFSESIQKMSDIETDEARYSRLNTINRDSSNREHSNTYVDEEKGNLLHTNKFQSALSSWHSLYVPRRYVLCIVGFWGFVFIYGASSLPRAFQLSFFPLLFPIIEVPVSAQWLLLVVFLLCCAALRAILSVAIVPMKDEYHYSSSEQGMLLSSFFVGYLFLQVTALFSREL